MAKTIAVVTMVSLRLGQVTRATSWRTCWTNSAALVFAMSTDLKGRGNSHPYGDSPGPFPAGSAGTASSVGRSGGARTPNPRFWRPVLYQLSYTPILERHARARPGHLGSPDDIPGSSRIKSGDDGRQRPSFDDFGDDAGADGAAAFANGKAQPLIHRDRCNQFDLHRDVVARHHHLGALRQPHRARHIGRAEVELRPVVGKKRSVPPALLLGPDIGLTLKAGVRGDRPGRGQHLA